VELVICSTRTAKSAVFTDWLNVSYSPDNSIHDEVHLFFDGLDCPVVFRDVEVTLIEVAEGKLKLSRGSKSHVVSASGAVLSELRRLGVFDEFLRVLSMAPHTITRLDAARDYGVDAPIVFKSLARKYPDDKIKISRKTVDCRWTVRNRDSDGQSSGTWYAGWRSRARITIRIYDKQLEALEVRGEKIAPTTRVEFTFKREVGATLRDVQMPYSLFHHFAGDKVVEAPDDADAWVSKGEPWESPKTSPKLPYELFMRRVESSPEIDRLVELSQSYGPEALKFIARTFERKLEAQNASRLAEAVSLEDKKVG